MTDDIRILPKALSIITTDRCTAACKNCCFGCKPTNTNTLTLFEMKKYIKDVYSSFKTLKIVIFTGGECFTLKDDLNKIVKYTSSFGLKTRVVSNGYWASSFKKAYLRLKNLKINGLDEINISTGDEHLEWVPFSYIINVIIACFKLNITLAINIETSEISVFTDKNILCDIRLKKFDLSKIHILKGQWMPLKKSTRDEYKANLNKDSIIYNPTIRCQSLFETISIDSRQQVYACCGLASSHLPFLRLGSARYHSVSKLYNYQFDDFLKIWLFTEGPKKIRDFCATQNNETIVDTAKYHMCQICADTFSNTEYLKILKDKHSEVLGSVMMKYFLLKKEMTIKNNIENE